MDDNEDLSFQLELLNQSTDPDENNLSGLFNSDNTNATAANSNNLTNDTFSLDHASLFSSAAVNIPIHSRTSNDPPAMMPTPFTPATSNATNNNVVSFPPSQNPTVSSSPSVVDPPEMNWPAINAYLRGQVLPGADVQHVYRCVVCDAEYVNPQALGGHMGVHRKNKNHRDEGTSSKTGHSKKSRHH